MNPVKTLGLPMWRVGMIAWRRRSEKRCIRLIRGVDGFLSRLFGFVRTIKLVDVQKRVADGAPLRHLSTTTGHQDRMAQTNRQRALQ